MARHRDNIVTVKLAVPKKVTLPNGRLLNTKYKRVNRNALSKSVTIKRTYRKRRRKQGPGFGRFRFC